MAYTLPNFNLLADVWAVGESPLTPDLPFIEDVPCQLYVNPKQGHNEGGSLISMMIRWPITGHTTIGHVGYLWFMKQSGYYFTAFACGNMHRGFPNEYRFAIVYPSQPDIARTEDAGIAD